MPQVDWRFPALLIAAMMLGIGLTYLQHRAYTRELNRALSQASGETKMLVSGRGRSFRGGAIAILIVDVVSQQIVWASLMSGVSVFARFHEQPELIGPVSGAADRVRGKQVVAAVEMALAQAHRPTTEPSGTARTLRRRSATTNPNPDARPATQTAPRPDHPERKH